MKQLVETLVKRGYPIEAAEQTAVNLQKMAPELKEALDIWLTKFTMPIIEVEGYSTDGLMSRFKGMTYPAALLTLDWLIREPIKAKQIIEKGIR